MTEAENSPELFDDENGARVIMRKTGPLQLCIDQRPARGQPVSGWPNMKVQTVHVVNNGDESGTLTITLVPQGSYVPSPGESNDPILEIEWVELQRPLQQHPRYLDGGAKALTDDDLDKIEAWKNADHTQKPALYSGLSENAKEFVGKLRRGQDSYITFVPVARRTTRHISRPTTGTGPAIQNPPSEIATDGYQYLKTADRAIKSSRYWERTEEWTGARFIDTDIY